MILLLFIIALISFTFLIISKYKQNDPFHPPPGPKALPFIGNLHQYDFKAPHVYLAKLANTYGPIASLRIGPTNMVVVQSASLAKEVLQTQDLNFCSRPKMVAMQKLSYNGLDISFGEYNEYFREVKKIAVVHLLSSKRVKSFAPIHQDEISRLINKISCDSSVVNLSNLVTEYACRLICRIAFGRSYEDGDGFMSKFRGLVADAARMFIDLAYSDFFPSLGWLDTPTGNSTRLDKIFRDLDAFYETIIQEHLHPNNRNTDKREDLVDVLLNLRKERSFSFDFGLDHVKALLMDMFLAGTETNAIVIIWAMTELIRNPTVMKKVQDELRNTIKNRGGDFITEEDLQNLHYFKAMVKETHRLHPAVPLLIVRQAIRNTKINGYDILAKTLVFVNAWAIGRDATSWDDPDKFIPERFLGSSIDFKGQDFELIPFGAGRRMCPGLHLGSLNVELGLANLLYSFDWGLPVGVNKEDIDTDTLPGLTMHKKNPLCLKASMRP